MELHDFLYPHQRPQMQTPPGIQAFEAHLETFAKQVGYVCNLEAGGKLSPEEAYAHLEEFWQNLQQSKETLGIGQAALG